MELEPKRIPCIGGPLHGQMYSTDTQTLRAIIPPYEATRAKMVDGWHAPVSDMRLLHTEYHRKAVRSRVGTLTLSGECFFWNHGHDLASEALAMMLALSMTGDIARKESSK